MNEVWSDSVCMKRIELNDVVRVEVMILKKLSDLLLHLRDVSFKCR